jgi:Holliday junction resolvase-like predicted endonuclease
MPIAQEPRAGSQPRLPHTPVRSADPRHVLGRLGEDLAAAHFSRLGFTVLARNVRTRYGEIDLIAFDGRALVFAEVKTTRASARSRRGTDADTDPLERLRG